MIKAAIFLKLLNANCARNYSHNYSHNFRKNRTLYDVLNLKRNCTSDDIRNSYLKLSKQFHPDVNGTSTNSKNTENFIEITEAYNVLSKQRTRYKYDTDLHTWEMSHGGKVTRSAAQTASRFHEPWRVNPNYDPNYNNEYYGMKGVKKVSNIKILSLISLFVLISTAFEFFLVRNSFTFNRENLDNLSKEATNKHASIRADAEKYGNEKQIERLAEKMIKKAE